MPDPTGPIRPDIAALRAAATAGPPPAGSSSVDLADSAGVPIRRLVAVLAPALVLALLAVGVWLAGAGQPPGTEPRGAAETQVGPGSMAWADTLTELDARRSLAFAAGDVRMLTGVYAPGSAAFSADAERLSRLVHAGVVARGLRLIVISASVFETAPGHVMLRVSDQLEPYQLVTTSGDPVARRAGRGVRHWLVTMVPARVPQGEWRIAAVAPA